MSFKVIIVFTVACFLGILVRATLAHTLYPVVFAPDFILVLVVALAVKYPSSRGVFAAFLLGLVSDFASGQFLGPSAAGCVVAFWLVVMVSTKMYADKAPAVMAVTFLASVSKSLTYLLILVLYADLSVVYRSVLLLVLYEAILTSIFAPIVIHALAWKQDLLAASRLGRKSV